MSSFNNDPKDYPPPPSTINLTEDFVRSLVPHVEKKPTIRLTDPTLIQKVLEANVAAQTMRDVRDRMNAIFSGNDLLIANRNFEQVSDMFILQLFGMILDIAHNNGTIDLVAIRPLNDTVNFLAENRKELKQKLLELLHKKGFLKPTPEIHWVVDRNNEKYLRRLGIDPLEFLQYFSQRDSDDKDDKQVFFELGPGNNTFKKEIHKATHMEYSIYGICNTLYYPMATLLLNIIDFQSLEKAIGQLITQDIRQQFCDFLYKVLVIKEGQTASDRFEYDDVFMRKASGNPHKFIDCVKSKIHLIDLTCVVPDTISRRDETGTYYPHKIQRPSLEIFDEICRLMIQNFESYIKKDDVFGHVPINPSGVLIGDFSATENLVDGQIDFAIGVRATVYKRGEDYIRFLLNFLPKLSLDGFYIDDSVRDNDGWYYRLAELAKVEKETGRKIHIILGPPFPGEDHCQDDVVPVSFFVTNSEEKLKYVQKNLKNGYRLVNLSDLANDVAYLTKLDSTGRTLQNFKQSC